MLDKIKELFNPKEKKNEAHEAYMKIMNSKKAYSFFSDQLVVFTDDLKEHEDETSGAYFNGWLLIDNEAEVEGEDSNIYVVLKDGNKMNLQAFGNEYGIWEEGDTFLENVKNLIADREA